MYKIKIRFIFFVAFFIPIQCFSDDVIFTERFNYAGNLLEDSDNENDDGSGNQWILSEDFPVSMPISVSSRVYSDSVSESIYYSSQRSSVSTQTLTWDVLFKGGTGGFFCVGGRFDPDHINGYSGCFDFGSVWMEKWTNGSPATIGSGGLVSNPAVAGTTYTIRFELNDNQQILYLDDVAVSTATDSDYTAPGRVFLDGLGIQDETTGPHVDNVILNGGKGVLIIDLSESGISRIDPCPVSASIDFSASNLSSGSWAGSVVQWFLSNADGLSEWPSKYRYINDPRPGTTLGQTIDMASQGRGYNMGWVLSSGSWTITATSVDSYGNQMSTTTETIFISTNTRTKKYINSATGVDDGSHGSSADNPYATLLYALSIHGGTDAIDYSVAGDHTESTGTANAIASGTGDNQYVHWDETGSKPIFTATTTVAVNNFCTINSGAVHTIWEGLEFYPSTTTTGGIAALTVSGSYFGLVNNKFDGVFNDNRFQSAMIASGGSSKGILISNETTGVESGSFAFNGGSTYDNFSVYGNTFGGCALQHIIRTTAEVSKINVLYNDMTQVKIADGGSGKSAVRYSQMSNLGHVYKNKITDGDIWIGSAGSANDLARHSRVESNYIYGTFGSGAAINLRESTTDVYILNNVIVASSGSTSRAISYISPHTLVMKDVNVRNNTIDFSTVSALGLGDSGLDVKEGSNNMDANLLIYTATMTTYQISVSSTTDVSFFTNNVLTPVSQLSTSFVAQVGATAYNEADWTATDYETGTQFATTTIDSNFYPSPGAYVTTSEGVYDDYYGNIRQDSSLVGAVNEIPLLFRRKRSFAPLLQ